MVHIPTFNASSQGPTSFERRIKAPKKYCKLMVTVQISYLAVFGEMLHIQVIPMFRTQVTSMRK